jgi:hypothetical protein
MSMLYYFGIRSFNQHRCKLWMLIEFGPHGLPHNAVLDPLPIRPQRHACDAGAHARERYVRSILARARSSVGSQGSASCFPFWQSFSSAMTKTVNCHQMPSSAQVTAAP